MKRLTFGLLAALAVTILLVACGGEGGDSENLSANIMADFKTCTEVVEDQCPEEQTSFSPDTREIFVAGRVDNATPGAEITATFMYEYNDGEFVEIGSYTITIENVSNQLHSFPVFYFQNPNDWVSGEYTIRIEMEDFDSEPIYKDLVIE